jgi:hypothetical protein
MVGLQRGSAHAPLAMGFHDVVSGPTRTSQEAAAIAFGQRPASLPRAAVSPDALWRLEALSMSLPLHAFVWTARARTKGSPSQYGEAHRFPNVLA